MDVDTIETMVEPPSNGTTVEAKSVIENQNIEPNLNVTLTKDQSHIVDESLDEGEPNKDSKELEYNKEEELKAVNTSTEVEMLTENQNIESASDLSCIENQSSTADMTVNEEEKELNRDSIELEDEKVQEQLPNREAETDKENGNVGAEPDLTLIEDDNPVVDIIESGYEEENFGNARSTRAKIKKEFKCYECSMSFTTETSFNEHTEAHHAFVDGYQCRQCKKAFPSKTGLLNHMRLHIASKKRTYKCALCEETFLTNKQLTDHKTVHVGMKFECKLAKKCNGLVFDDHCEYLYHELTHYNNPKPKCVECGTYINASYMKRHLLTHYDRKSVCGICGNVFNNEYNLKKHLERHDNEVKCVECGKIFAGKDYLDNHMATHTGVKKYQCLYCGKGFATTQQRKLHTMIHTDEKPHQCSICGHRSRQKGDADKHKATHSNVKKYECDYCQKKFFHKESVLAHIRTHTQSRVYNCTICDFTTATKTGLRNHVTYKHLEDRPFKCEACKLSFKMNCDLLRHNLSKMHRNNMYGLAKKL